MQIDKYGPNAGMFPAVSNTIVGSVIYPPGGRYGPRVQADYQLVLLHTGMMEVRIDETLYSVPPGTLTLLKPGHVEEFCFSKDTETWHRWIAVHPRDNQPEQKAWAADLPLFVSLTEDLNQLINLMLSLQNASSTEEPWRLEVLNSLGLSALGMFVLLCNKHQQREGSHPAVSLAKAFIREKYHEDVHLSDIAKQAHITPEHLIRVFRKSEGRTPMEYVWAYRIQRAISLLRDTGLTVGDIAERTGFKTSHHFTRAIKERTGMAPTEIRRRSWVGTV